MTKTKEKILLSTPVFDVVEKSFKETKFKPVGINCKDWALIILHDSSSYLLVKQTRWGSEDYTVEFPCGTVEEGETGLAAAVRECREETGIQISEKDVVNVGMFSPNPAYFNNMMHVYCCKIPNIKERFNMHAKLKLDKNEDCKPYIGTLDDLTPTAITYAALELFNRGCHQ